MSENKNKKNHKREWLIVLFAVAVIAVCIAVAFPSRGGNEEAPAATNGPEETTETAAPSNDVQEQLNAAENTTFWLGDGLEITKVGSYTGIYMEDGTDEIVSGVTMILVENTGEEYIQYAEITLTGDNGEANFVLTTLFPGDTVVVLETERKPYSAAESYTEAAANNVAVFSEVPSLCEDRLELQALDGVINVTNISDADITGDIVIYYKNTAGGLYYGGITYRVRITGGIAAGEIRQIVSEHFSDSDSEIVFVTCG